MCINWRDTACVLYWNDGDSWPATLKSSRERSGQSRKNGKKYTSDENVAFDILVQAKENGAVEHNTVELVSVCLLYAVDQLAGVV